LNPFVLLLLFYSVKQQNNKTTKQKDSNKSSKTKEKIGIFSVIEKRKNYEFVCL